MSNLRSIKPTDNRLMAILTHGDGWHNYHHTFPWDYKTGDLGNYDYNVSATFVELFAKIGKHSSNHREPLRNRNLVN